MKTKSREWDRFDIKVDEVARRGRTWDEERAARHARALKAAETRRRRARGEPDPEVEKAVKRTRFPALMWRAEDGRVAVQTSYRAALVARIRETCPGAWWCSGLAVWLVDPVHVRAALALLREFYVFVRIDIEVAKLLGYLIFDPQGPDGEEAAA